MKRIKEQITGGKNTSLFSFFTFHSSFLMLSLLYDAAPQYGGA
jgi:hypothetical protein